MAETKQYTYALAGNPNSGKTTLFNALTGANQFVGNWPGVTVEKKEGIIRKHADMRLVDLPGTYSLSPYTLEEVVSRNYLIQERPDVIIDIVDATNLERNLYLTSQLMETGIPIIIALNMMDVIRKNGDKILVDELSERMGCPVVGISAGNQEGLEALISEARKLVGAKVPQPFVFDEEIENALQEIERKFSDKLDSHARRWSLIKLFERDEKALKSLSLSDRQIEGLDEILNPLEQKLEDDAESILVNARYLEIAKRTQGVLHKKSREALTVSDKIDRVVTHPILALPIFAVIMFLVYYIAISTVGTFYTDWANDGLFGDGWHLFGIGTSEYTKDMNEYAAEHILTPELMTELQKAKDAGVIGADQVLEAAENGEFNEFQEAYDSYKDSIEEAGFPISEIVDSALEAEDVPATENYGIWVPGIPVLLDQVLTAIHTSPWLSSLILDGIVAGVGAVLGFVPQMAVLFILLAFLEGSGYMARIAFILDRIFRRFGLSGKSFIPMLISTGCGVPGIMASRTIENANDRRMTIMTATWMPCSAKLPIIAMIATALFGGTWWVGPSAYFLGIISIIIVGLMLKKTKLFAGDPAPFVMELPAYHLPKVSYIWHSVWERVSSFITRAGTVILLSSILIWATSSFAITGSGLVFDHTMELEDSLLGAIGNGVKWIFAPLGFGNIRATIATVMGLVAKEEVVAVFGVLDFTSLTALAGYSFLAFNLLCAPCFAACGAIAREMNSRKWTVLAIGFQCGYAYVVALMIYQFGMAISGQLQPVGFTVAVIAAALILFQLFRPNPRKHELQRATA
ncbi:MAG: ferrous iron transporter B [Peptoniphilaceae bacterium]|nr:ferrous iron transporter B [Peptoniphilaceae bacterium]